MEYKYNLQSDFKTSTEVNLSQLNDIINADPIVVLNCTSINIDDVIVTINFASALNATQKIALDTLISSYVFIRVPTTKVSSSYSSVVSATNGDYTSIAAAFQAGEQSVYVKNGLYYETADIKIPNYGQLIGESTGGVIIVMIGGKIVKCDGSNGVMYSSGTISITNNTNVITGVGTAFTSLSPGHFISLGTNYYTILSIQSDTSLRVAAIYVGSTITNASYNAGPMHSGVVIENLVITAAAPQVASYGLYLRSIRHSCINSVVVSKCKPNIYMTNCSDLSINNIITYLGLSVGMHIKESISMSCHTINAFNNVSYGLLSENTIDTIYESCAAESNYIDGYRLLYNTSTKLIDCTAKFNNSNGVYTDVNTINFIISNSTITNNSNYGILCNSSSDIISSNIIKENLTGGIDMHNTNNVISNNIILNNAGNGITVESDAVECSITCNKIHESKNDGIRIYSNKCLITNNSILNSTGNAITVANYNHIINNNMIENNTYGIYCDATSVDNIITNNIIMNNTTGLELFTGSSNNVVSLNIIKNNDININDEESNIILNNF